MFNLFGKTADEILSGIDDYYVPSSAAILLDALRGLDDESAAVTITLAAYEAEGELMRN